MRSAVHKLQFLCKFITNDNSKKCEAMHKFSQLASATDCNCKCNCNCNCTAHHQTGRHQADRLQAKTEDLLAKLLLIYYRKLTEQPPRSEQQRVSLSWPFQPTQLYSSAAAVSSVVPAS